MTLFSRIGKDMITLMNAFINEIDERGGPSKNPKRNNYKMKNERYKSFTDGKESYSSFLVPDFVDIQRKSFFHLLEKGILEEFSKVNPIVSNISQLKLTFYPEKYLLILPDFSLSEAIVQGKTYSCKLYVPVLLGGHKAEISASVYPVIEEGDDNLRDNVATSFSKRPTKYQEKAWEGVASKNNYVTNRTSEQMLFGEDQSATNHNGSDRVVPNDTKLYASWKNQRGDAQFGLGAEKIDTFTHPKRRTPPRDGNAAEFRSPFKRIGEKRAAQRNREGAFSWVLLGNLPLMTKRGHFVINGSPRVLVNQLTRCPGIYFHERRWGVGKTEKRLVYADFVSRRGAWLRLQADKAGEVWARLKRTPKIPFALFYQSMIACESNPLQWTALDQDTLIEMYEEVNPTKRESSAEGGKAFLDQKFKNLRTYDLGVTGRDQLNLRFGTSIATQQLTSKDLYYAFEQIKELQNHRIFADDIDNLSNRRVRAAGDLVQGQFETGLYRLEKVVLAKMRKPIADVSCKTLLTSKPLNGALREFFGSSPLSQYMDQTNPLAEITQKRRVSSLGPGGISRETAGMAIRGIHPTHYGRICPIETPEGKNAGLVNSLTAFTQVREDGTLESPYYSILQGQVQNEGGFRFLPVEEEEHHSIKIAPGDVKVTDSRFLPSNLFPIREAGNPQEDFRHASREMVNVMAVSPIQMISIATSLIPFLEHDDANRALMGSNMQRQAVPLLRPERPIVGTGLEALVIAASGHAVESHRSGYVSFVSNEKVMIYSKSFPFNKSQESCSSPSLIHFYKKCKGGGQRTLTRCASGGPLKRIWVQNLQTKGAIKSSFSFTNSPQLVILRSVHQPLSVSNPTWEKGSRQSLSTPSLNHRTRNQLLHYKDVEYRRSLEFNKIAYKGEGTPLQRSQDGGFELEQSGSLSEGLRPQEQNQGVQHLLTPSLQANWGATQSGSKGGSIQNANLSPPSSSDLQGVTSSLLSPFSLCKQSDSRQSESTSSISQGRHPCMGRGLETSMYPLQSYCRSNQETCLNHVPAVIEGEWIQEGDLVADCSASHLGELALGKNVRIAYLPWEGYNFEDAVVISERLVLEDVYTSIHIQKYEVETKETKFGFESITRDVPGLDEERQARLDKYGVAIIGSWVKEGDILVGKVSPKGLQPLSPYERLAYDIANVEAATTEDTSLRVPKGVEGRVINYHAYNDTSSLLDAFEPPLHGSVASLRGALDSAPLKEAITGCPGRVRIYLAEERRIQVGDKVAGRHGNKGIVSTILPRQDMPYLPDGQIVDVVLNPLGIPSRMNVGQVFECLLGLAGMQLGQHFQVTPFDEVYGAEASRSLVYLKLYQARLRTNQNWIFDFKFPGKVALFDGRTGQLFDQWVTVGQAYMLKLVHLVDEKIHARSTGPYSLVTKQPLGGRSKHGGQRLGEMEVWALEGFGAAYILQEMLTSKSDDVIGREQAVEAILFKGKMSLGNPEAFKVLVRELQSLCLDVGVYAISSNRLHREVIDVGSIL